MSSHTPRPAQLRHIVESRPVSAARQARATWRAMPWSKRREVLLYAVNSRPHPDEETSSVAYRFASTRSGGWLGSWFAVVVAVSLVAGVGANALGNGSLGFSGPGALLLSAAVTGGLAKVGAVYLWGARGQAAALARANVGLDR